MHRVRTIGTWVSRLQKHARFTAISMELARFDPQNLENHEIAGVEYQQGTLAGYEVRENLPEKWGRRRAYCDAQNVALEIDHIVARGRGGSHRISNLTLIRAACNRAKNNRDVVALVETTRASGGFRAASSSEGLFSIAPATRTGQSPVRARLVCKPLGWRNAEEALPGAIALTESHTTTGLV